MGYIQFNNGSGTTTNNTGISFGTGSSAVGPNSVPEVMRIDSLGNVSTTGANATTGYNMDLRGGIRIAATSVAGSQISLNNATSNWIAWNTGGAGAPTFTTSSAGTKLILYPQVGSSSADYAIGIETNTLWFGVPTTATQQFKWYGGTTQAMLLSGAGVLTVASSTQTTALGVNTTPSATAGTILATNEITAYSSDGRLKENVELITDPIPKVMSLRGVTFDWKSLTKDLGFDPVKTHDVGVIAQEVEAVLPEAIRPAPFDRDADGNSKSGENYLTVQYEKLTALLIEAVKAQQAQIEKLEARITTLEPPQ
jgi:hypothetical protein